MVIFLLAVLVMGREITGYEHLKVRRVITGGLLSNYFGENREWK